MKVAGKDYRTVWMENGRVFMIEQNALPFEFKIIELKTYQDTCHAIKTMIVRGAGAIGVTAGFGMAQVFLETNNETDIENGKKEIEATRPTAQNLFYATKRVFNAAKNSENPKEAAVVEAQKIADEDAEACRQIGIHGAKLIESGFRILTHCNASALAFTDFGSALSPVYQAASDEKDVFVFVSETRPRNQGMRLTAWELKNEGIKHKIIPDSAAGFLMQKREIDLVIVGADRICGKTGDTANKIGTYEKAVCAKENNIPFYVAAPSSTIDFELESGDQIPIEERSEDEVLYVWGQNDRGEIERVRIAPEGSRALNLAFDITPAKLITGIITEKGIFKPNELYKLHPK